VPQHNATVLIQALAIGTAMNLRRQHAADGLAITWRKGAMPDQSGYSAHQADGSLSDLSSRSGP
jgi:hypothetical protein